MLTQNRTTLTQLETQWQMGWNLKGKTLNILKPKSIWVAKNVLISFHHTANTIFYKKEYTYQIKIKLNYLYNWFLKIDIKLFIKNTYDI